MLTENKGNPGRAAVYCRVSSEEQAQAGTIQNQINAVKRHCADHGLEIVEVFADDGVSGTTDPFKRPAAGRMLTDAKAGRFSIILVYRLDRIARSLYYLMNLNKKLEEWGTVIKSITEPLDTSTSVGRFFFQQIGSIAELERETIRERTQMGRQRAIANGKAIGRIPTGYALDDHGRLCVHPEEGPIVHTIFEMASRGVSGGAIARSLNERRVPTISTSRGYKSTKPITKEWGQVPVLDILHNPVYWTGEWRQEHKDGTFSAVPAPNLVEHATAIRAHHQLAENNHVAKGRHRVYLLSGLIRCGVCGARVVGFSNGKDSSRRYYACNAARDRKTCTSRSIRADLLDAQVWMDIHTVSKNPTELAERIRRKLSESAHGVEAARLELDATVKEHEALTATRLDAQLRADRGDMTRDELTRYLRAGVSRVTELERRRLDLAEKLALMQVQESKVASLEEICLRLGQLVDDAEGDPSLQQQLVKSLVREVVLYLDSDGRPVVDIEYMMSQPEQTAGEHSTPQASTTCPWCLH